MSITRLEGIAGFGIDEVARAAAADPTVLRLENLDTDLRPPAGVVAVTGNALTDDDANSYLPFIGRRSLRAAVAAHVARGSGITYDADRNVVITAGGTEGLFVSLLATVDPGREVILTDPTYAGMTQRVRLAGGRPMHVPLRVIDGRWRLDLDALAAAVTPQTAALFLMSPSMPSGAVFNRAEWQAIARLCVERDLWLIYNAAMERILFDGLTAIHPASFPGMAERTITVGSVSKELRMIGWRIGWVVGPERVMNDIVWTHTYTVVTPPGISQAAAEYALRTSDDGVIESVREWQRRRDMLLAQFDGFPVIVPDGGWSLLLDTQALGLEPAEASRILLEQTRIAATPMTGWGEEVAGRHVRFVFSNEPVPRLAQIRQRLQGTALCGR
ncbi:MAG: pyridoxal phosphate-dependent aminotransferase [Dehalococcoidia bacterium]